MISKFMVNGNIVDFIQSNSVNRLSLVISLLFYSTNSNSSFSCLSSQMPLKVYSTSTMSGLFMGE